MHRLLLVLLVCSASCLLTEGRHVTERQQNPEDREWVEFVVSSLTAARGLLDDIQLVNSKSDAEDTSAGSERRQVNSDDDDNDDDDLDDVNRQLTQVWAKMFFSFMTGDVDGIRSNLEELIATYNQLLPAESQSRRQIQANTTTDAGPTEMVVDYDYLRAVLTKVLNFLLPNTIDWEKILSPIVVEPTQKAAEL